MKPHKAVAADPFVSARADAWRCPSCLPTEGAVNWVPGCIFVGFGHGWQPCRACGGSGILEAYRVADSMGRCLQRIAGSDVNAPGDPPSLAGQVLEGIAEHHGFARVVRHHGRVQLVELTEAGRLALFAWTALQEARHG